MTGKEKVARFITSFVSVNYLSKPIGNYKSPNWILDDIPGIKGATAERRLRELRSEYLFSWCDTLHKTAYAYGYRPSREHENHWEYEKEFIEFLKDYVENKKK